MATRSSNQVVDIEKYSYEETKKFIVDSIKNHSTQTYLDKGLEKEEFKKVLNRKENLNKAIDISPYGDVNAKAFLKQFIQSLLLQSYGVNSDNIDYIIDFKREGEIHTSVKFDIILHHYKKTYKYNALEHIIEKYELTNEVKLDEEYFCVTKEDIDMIYDKESLSLNFDDKLTLLINRIYREDKGLGIIDEIKDQNIDGVSGGVSGIPSDLIIKSDISEELLAYLNRLPRNYDSVWIFYKGKNVHMRFLSFGDEKELRRVCENIYKFGNPGQLSEKAGYKINDLADNSRIVVFRPSYCESWAFFVRMFDSIKSRELEELYTGQLAIISTTLIKYLMKGCQTTIVTGEQGAGKTILLVSMIKYISSIYTIRTLEKMFETQLRKVYPYKNILTVRISDDFPAEDSLAVLKKTDGNVTFFSEIDDNKVVPVLIEVSEVASKFTIGAHHANTFKALINSWRNSLINVGSFTREDLAEEQVAQVIKFNIHLDKDAYGIRRIARITECIPHSEEPEYPMDFLDANLNEKDVMRHFMINMNTFFKSMTIKKKAYIERDIVVYDFIEEEYKIKSNISDEKVKRMMENMSKKDRIEFKSFLDKYFNKNC